MDSEEKALQEILKRFDRSSPDKLLKSLALEFLRLHRGLELARERIVALEAQAPGGLPTKVVVGAAQVDDARGFHKLEEEGESAQRWTGPEPEFSFEVLVDRAAPAEVALYFARYFFPDEQTELRCEADGAAIALNVAPGAGGLVARGLLPAREEKSVTSLRFTCLKMGSPSEKGEGDDRILGLLFRRLEIQPAEVTAAPVNLPAQDVSPTQVEAPLAAVEPAAAEATLPESAEQAEAS